MSAPNERRLLSGLTSCENFPYCGHEYGVCPRHDPDGTPLCLCGKRLLSAVEGDICTDCLGLTFEDTQN